MKFSNRSGALVLIMAASANANAMDVTFDGSGGGAAAGPWVGTVAGNQDVVGFTDDGAGTRTWEMVATYTSTPSLPVPHARSAAGRGMYDLIQFIVDWVLSYAPINPNELNELTGFQFDSSITFSSDEYGLFIQTNGISSVMDDAQFVGSFEGSLDLPMPRAETMYVEEGTVTPAGPGAAWLQGTGKVPFAGSDEFLTLDVTGWYFFDPTLELPAPYTYSYGGVYENVLDEPLTWEIHTTYSEHTEVVGVPDLIGRFEPVRVRPSPFIGSTSIGFDQPTAGHVDAMILDVNGRMVKRLLSRELPAGEHEVRWDGRDSSNRVASPGVYYFQRSDARSRSTGRVVKR